MSQLLLALELQSQASGGEIYRKHTCTAPSLIGLAQNNDLNSRIIFMYHDMCRL